MSGISVTWTLLLVLQVVQIGVIIWLLRAIAPMRSSVAVKPTAESLGSLAAQMEPLFRRQFQQLADAQARAQDLVERSERVLHHLVRIETRTTSVEADEAQQHETAVLLARSDARRLLAEGRTIAEVATATGLPQGEVAVLANLLRAKQTGD